MARKRTADSRKELESIVEDFVERGYNVKTDDPDRAVVKDSGLGSWKIHILLLIFTVGIGNIPYIIYKLVTGEKVEIVVE